MISAFMFGIFSPAKPYYKTDKKEVIEKQKTNKRENRRVSSALFFCEEVGSSFETVAELEEHELLVKPIIHSDLSNMDQVKNMFFQKMKGTHTQTFRKISIK